jgi:hypothetical protein
MQNEKEELTYEDIYDLFCEQNPDLEQIVNDWRPEGFDTIRIWVGESGHTASFTVTYVRYLDSFVLKSETKGDNI